GELRHRPPLARSRGAARPSANGLREGDPRRPGRRLRALPPRRGRVRRRLGETPGARRGCRYPRKPMATAERDYYELLGVRRDAPDGDIKRAFRKLARELHPDVSTAPDAEERFREAAEAYEVLPAPDRRATYDRFGHEGLRGRGFTPGDFDLGNL